MDEATAGHLGSLDGTPALVVVPDRDGAFDTFDVGHRPSSLSRASAATDRRLEENLGGADVEFTADELLDLTTAASNLQLIGDRLPKRYLELTGQ